MKFKRKGFWIRTTVIIIFIVIGSIIFTKQDEKEIPSESTNNKTSDNSSQVTAVLDQFFSKRLKDLIKSFLMTNLIKNIMNKGLI